jgi:hypothetical protein
MRYRRKVPFPHILNGKQEAQVTPRFIVHFRNNGVQGRSGRKILGSGRAGKGTRTDRPSEAEPLVQGYKPR